MSTGGASGPRDSDLASTASRVRALALTMIGRAGMGHPGGSLSQAEILVALYYRVLRVDPARPAWSDRDRFVFSKGHACASYYATLALRGYFPLEDLDGYGELESHLQSHPDRTKTPGVDASSGSLGQGLSLAVGMALAARMRKRAYRTFVLLGDGECQAGQVWEAAMAASHYRLGALVAIVDHNGMQAKGRCSDIMGVEPLDGRFEAFGWRVLQPDGHDVEALARDLSAAAAGDCWGSPAVVIARTVKGKGVSFMENETRWHNAAPTPEELERAIAELRGACDG